MKWLWTIEIQWKNLHGGQFNFAFGVSLDKWTDLEEATVEEVEEFIMSLRRMEMVIKYFKKQSGEVLWEVVGWGGSDEDQFEMEEGPKRRLVVEDSWMKEQ